MRRRDPVPRREPAPGHVLRYSGPWTADGLTAWLVARTAWRESTAEPLPRLTALERSAMANLKVPRALVEAEAASTSPSRDRKDSR